jgi:hypothetical protein
MQKTISAIVISVMPATLGEKSAARNRRGTTPRLPCLHECGVAEQFPTFRGRRHAEAAGQAGDGANDCHAVARRIEPSDERAIYLDFIEGKAAQVTEGRIAVSKIIHCDSNAEITNLMKGL